MKKTNIFQVTIIAVLAALFGSGGGTAWGQTYLNGAADVNNYFGAGESATITGGNITWPQTTPPPSTPVPLANAGNRIIIGGTDPSANNSVIRVYNGKGYGSGWISVLRIPVTNPPYPYNDHGCSNSALWQGYSLTGDGYPYSGQLKGFDVLFYNDPQETTSDFFERTGAGWDGQCPPAGTQYQKGTSAKFQRPLIYSFNTFNENKFTGTGKWTTTATADHTQHIAPCGYDLFESTVTPSTAPGSTYGDAQIAVSHHQGHMYTTDVRAISRPLKAYTSTMNSTFTHSPQSSGNTLYSEDYNVDDNIKLTQFKGEPLTDSKALINQRIPQSLANNRADA